MKGDEGNSYSNSMNSGPNSEGTSLVQRGESLFTLAMLIQRVTIEVKYNTLYYTKMLRNFIIFLV